MFSIFRESVKENNCPGQRLWPLEQPPGTGRHLPDSRNAAGLIASIVETMGA